MKYTELILLASRTFLSLSETTILGKEHIISKDIIVHSFRCEKFSQSFFSDTTFNIFCSTTCGFQREGKASARASSCLPFMI